MLHFRRPLQYDINLPVNLCRSSFRYISSSKDDYEYLQKSILPTGHFQKSLPRLPIPKLDKTCERYLRALKPLLDSYTYSKTAKIVKEFETGEGVALQKQLVEEDKRNKHTSYISQPWFDMYLSDRTPLPINYNPCLVYVSGEDEFYDQQLVKTANLIISSLRFYKSLKDNLLEPEVFHLNPKKSNNNIFRIFTRLLPSTVSWYGAYLMNAYPLDMSQYSNLFNSTRIPEKGKDRIFQDKSKRHILVLRKGNFYTVEVLDEYGNIKPPNYLLSAINSILKNTTEANQHPVGILTTCERNHWAEVRQHLEKLGNEDVLNKIDSSLFVVALDNAVLQTRRDIVRWFLHSDGMNRWFDKSFTLISTTTGHAGINFEHSWGDGVAILRYFQDIFLDTSKTPRVNKQTDMADLESNASPEKLNFIIDDRIRKEIQDALVSYQKVCNSLSVHDVMCDLGKNFCKQYKVSPDAVMQLGFQMAYYERTKGTTATYESCSTAAFKHGRTETVRPCTIETKEFCEALSSGKLGNQELRELINKCSIVHSDLTKNAAMGQGFDRHLFALRKIAERKSKDLPQIFTNSSYELINRNILSTSTLSSDLVCAGGFGPVVPNGFGIAYMIRKDNCGMIITNYKEHTDGRKFADCLGNSFQSLKSIFMG